ncbi:MAG: sigma-70 family RNA polymerase sigma factor [Paracoccaceae bacterium]
MTYTAKQKSDELASQMARRMNLIAKKRDRAAFTSVFSFYAPRIKAFLMRGNCSPASAEEVTQDVMVTLWQKAHTYDPEKSSLGTWLFRIARNRRIDLIRRDKSNKLDAQDPTMFPTIEEIDTDGIDARERDQRIRTAISTLPKEQMQLIRLSFFEGQPHSRIAKELDVPLGTVKSRIRLAFTRLRKQLSEDCKVDID